MYAKGHIIKCWCGLLHSRNRKQFLVAPQARYSLKALFDGRLVCTNQRQQRASFVTSFPCEVNVNSECEIKLRKFEKWQILEQVSMEIWTYNVDLIRFVTKKQSSPFQHLVFCPEVLQLLM